MSKKAEDLAVRYERKTDIISVVPDLINEQYHINAFYFPRCAIITSDPEIQAFSWGLIPSWTSTVEDAQEIRKITLNIRAEAIFQKPFSKEAIMKRRCLIPSTGYFEWRYENGKKTPYFIHLKDEEIFSIAGIYDSWTDKETGSSLITFSLITTRANPFAAYFQNVKKRMPLILSAEEEKRWLEPELNMEEIGSLMKPVDAGCMTAYQVDNDFVHKPSNDPSILARASMAAS